jgi:hypothetical protein
MCIPIQEDSRISNCSIAGGWYYLALAMSLPGRTEAAGSKIRRTVILPAATVAGGRKNAQIHIIKRAKKLCRGKCNSQDLVSGEEHTASRRKLNNFTWKHDLTKNEYDAGGEKNFELNNEDVERPSNFCETGPLRQFQYFT